MTTGFERLLTGHRLGDRYRIDEVIGRGGMGAVYRATDERLDRAVAVKVVTVAAPDAEARARVRARFHREARAAARLQHPNVVVVHDFGTDARLDLDYLVMELLRGEDLAARLAAVGRLDAGFTADILFHAARGLAAGHAVGLIHRDIKPGNLFLERTPAGALRVRVLDFGIVQWAAEENEATVTQLTLVGGRGPHSPAYAAPEQLRGETKLTPACDVFSLGVTGYQMLTGTRPFGEPELQRLASGVPVPLPSLRTLVPGVPEGLEWLLRTAMASHPADRFPDAAALADALAPLRGAAGAAGAPGAATRAPAERRAEIRVGEPVRTPAVEQDETWYAPPPPRPAAATRPAERPFAPPPAAPARESTLFAPDYGAYAPAPAYADPRAMAAAPAVARPGLVRRAASAMWQLTLTLASAAAVAGLWYWLREAQLRELSEPFYAAVVGLTLAVPWFAHRLSGRRGSYWWALIGSTAVTAAAFRFFQPLAGPEATTAVLPLAQLAAAGWLLRLTRRRRRDPEHE